MALIVLLSLTSFASGTWNTCSTYEPELTYKDKHCLFKYYYLCFMYIYIIYIYYLRQADFCTNLDSNCIYDQETTAVLMLRKTRPSGLLVKATIYGDG